MTEVLHKEFSRKAFLKGGGALVVGFSLAGATAGKAGAAVVPSPETYLPPVDQVDSYLTVHADNTVSFWTSQIETGTGIQTGYVMLVAEELDLSPAQVRHGGSDSWRVVNSGNTGGSSGIQTSGGPRLRAAAATARQKLLSLASTSLGVPVSSLSVSNGFVSGGGRSVTYGELVGGKLLNATISPLTMQPGAGITKPVSQYKLIGTNVPRVDIPDKVTGKYTYLHNIKVPGMVHARWVRPRGQGAYGTGAKIVSVDASSIRNIPGVRIVRRGDLLAVVAEREYDAIQAAAQLKVEWKDEPLLPTTGNLWKQMREHDAAGKAPARHLQNTGNVDGALRSAAKTVSQTYMYHYNGHATIGPSAAVADVRPDRAVVYTNTQKLVDSGPGGMVVQVADILKMPPRNVRTFFYEGSASYGEPQTRWDIAPTAALLSQIVGKPVRLVLMRWDEHGWDLFGPAQLMDVRGGIDSSGKIVGYDFVSLSQPTANHITTLELLGEPHPTPGTAGPNTSNTAQGYDIPNKRVTGKTLPVFEGYLRRANLRNPQGPQTAFAAEQMIDELAFAAGMDPLAFRRQNISDERWLTALNAAAHAARWEPRVAASNLSNATVVTGRGFGFGRHGSSSYSAVVAEVEVNRKTGKITAKHLYSALDAGLSISPALVENQIVGAGIQAVSRALEEVVTFNKTRVTGLDWVTYPILRFKDAPKVTPIVVQRKELLPLGTGESPHPGVAPAIANAFFDATGVRIRQAPMTPAVVRATLKAAGKLAK
jgi:CO/xanthine dehydrogenase Mo-binding subunit